MISTTGWPRRPFKVCGLLSRPGKVKSGARRMTSACMAPRVKTSERARRSVRMTDSDLEDVGFLGQDGLVDFFDETIGEFLDFLFQAFHVVLGDGSRLLRLFQ